MYQQLVKLGVTLLRSYVDLMMDYSWLFTGLHLLLALVIAMNIG